MTKIKEFIKSPFVWIGTTYFAEGFPYTVIRIISSIFFRDKGVSLENVGLTSLYGLPWTIKFLWGPYVDKYSTRRNWLLSTEILFSIILLLTTLLAPIDGGLFIIGVLFFIAAFIAATHDIAIDGFYMEALSNAEQEKFIGYRILAYRLSMMFGQGVIVTIGAVYSWTLAFMASAVLFILFFFYHLWVLPKNEETKYEIKELLPYLKDLLIFPIFIDRFKKKQKRELTTIFIIYTTIGFIIWFKYFLKSPFYSGLAKEFFIFKKLSYARWIGLFILLSLVVLILLKGKIKKKLIKNKDSFYAKSFLAFIDRKKIAYAIAFIIFIRTGEFMLHSMTGTFFVDLGIKTHIGWITSGVGLPASIFGALLGGWIISKYGFKKTAFPLLLLQNITNLGYMWLAWSLSDFVIKNTGNKEPIAIGVKNLVAVASINGFEQFSAGLGTAVLTTYLLRLCVKEFKTAHFALGTGLMSVSGVVAGIAGGIITTEIGYEMFFLISFISAIPGMVLLYFIPQFTMGEK